MAETSARGSGQPDVHELVLQAALRASRGQMQLFARLMKRALHEQGVDKDTIGRAWQATLAQYKEMSRIKRECAFAVDEALHLYELPGTTVRDIMGRVVVEFCLIRSGDSRLIFPEKTREDDEARAAFTPGVIPRPFMRHFLVSVRGTIEGLDGFQAKSMLFGEGNELYEECRAALSGYIARHTKGGDDGGSTVLWLDVYEDPDVKRVALRFVGEVHRRIAALGAERYLRIIENIRQQDPERNTVSAMGREFVDDDMEQLLGALERGERMLRKELDAQETQAS
ncbi:MAG: hypothetical protein AB7E47_15800 [Desulfovibrionaceae bacterium]